jgi:hypothetical protein
MKRKRWTYRVYIGTVQIGKFTSRKKAKAWMQHVTELDFPSLIPGVKEINLTMIGELK